MKIAMVGTGYVGLVTGTCFADSGNQVTCIDIDEKKIARLLQGDIPIYEPGLSEMVLRNIENKRLQFTTALEEAVATADVVYLAVGTPQSADGSANLGALWAVVDSVAPVLPREAVIVVKSTVPVGTNTGVYNRLKELTGRVCEVASNPEFLKEGAAIADFSTPDRVVVGVRSEKAERVLRELYEPYVSPDRPFVVMSPESAELTKYVANALLSTKISFINEMANLCQKMQGDINDVRKGIGHDQRIGFAFLAPGVGYGGSCFPKDVRALASMARQHGIEPRILDAVDEVNDHQKHVLWNMIQQQYGAVKGKTVAIWGLAFKPQTDDIREAPALVLIEHLLEAGAKVKVYDPEAMENVRADYGDKIQYAKSEIDCVTDADLLAINTEWAEFRQPDFAAIAAQMNSAVIFDGRNLYEPQAMRSAGFRYYSIGRTPVETPVLAKRSTVA